MVVISGVPEGEQKAAEVGATAYVQKPFDPIDLLATLRKCCW
jgi:DNA-binding response OmpR family regulator